jgi:hypothetical protein
VMEFNSGILIGTMVTKINCAVVTMHNCQKFSFERPLEAKPHKNLSEKVSSLRTAMFNHLATLNVIWCMNIHNVYNMHLPEAI